MSRMADIEGWARAKKNEVIAAANAVEFDFKNYDATTDATPHAKRSYREALMKSIDRLHKATKALGDFTTGVT